MKDIIADTIYKMKFLHKYKSRHLNLGFLFIYWDRKAQVLEFEFFNKVTYYYIEK